MKKIALLMAAISVVAGSAASAQQVVYVAAPARAEAMAQSSYFPLGTPVVLNLRTQVSTKDNKPGDRIYFEVAEPLMYRGQIVVPVGSTAVGEVAEVQRNGHFGVKGRLGIRLLYLLTPSGPVRLSGNSHKEGASGTAASVATIVLVSWLGFLIHGTSAKVPAGAVVNAYLADDLRFTVNQSAQVAAGNQVQPDGYVGGVAIR